MRDPKERKHGGLIKITPDSSTTTYVSQVIVQRLLVRFTHLEIQVSVDAVVLSEHVWIIERRALRNLHLPLLGIIDTIFAGFGRLWCETQSKQTPQLLFPVPIRNTVFHI